MAVRVAAQTVFEPDVAVRCGKALDDDAVTYDDPVIIVEVFLPSNRTVDSAIELDNYFKLPSRRHYLLVRPK